VDQALTTTLDASSTVAWQEVPFTGETLNTSLSSVISERITPARSYAGSKLTQGSVSGQVSYELQSNAVLNNFILSALQTSQAIDVGSDPVAGTSGVVVSAVGTGVDDDRTITLTGLTATQGAVYSVVVNGVNYNYTAGSTPTTSTIATGLASAIDAATAYAASATGAVITIDTGAGLASITFTSWVPSSWAPGEAVTNGSTKNCFAFLKRIRIDTTHFDFYVFRGCQVSSMSFEIKPGALLTGSCTIMGIKPEAPLENVVKPAGWTFTDAPVLPLMSGVDSLQNFKIMSGAVDTGVVLQDLTITLDNQLRQQTAVGLGHPFAAGVASGRFMASLSGTAYYASPKIYNAFLNDTSLSISGSLLDSNDDGIEFLFDYCKVTSGSLPEGSGPDQDLVVKTEFRAFESATNGTVKITRAAG
jgi:hypothetical protein